MNFSGLNFNTIGRVDLSELGRNFQFNPANFTPPAAPAAPAARPLVAIAPPVFQEVVLSEQAQQPQGRTNIQNLQLFGGDRKTAVGTLIASGAKGENPKTNFFQNIGRKLFGGTKTSTKRISGTQSINSKVKVRNFNFKELRLTTKGTNAAGAATTRHVDFLPKTPTGQTAQVKDAGTVIAKGQVTRMFEQEVSRQGGLNKVVSNYFDPKSGAQFLKTTETGNRVETSKMGTIGIDQNRGTDRTIEVLNGEGQTTKKYVFDYGSKRVSLQNLNADGSVASTYRLSKKTNFGKLVEQLSQNSPGSRAARAAFGGRVVSGGGGRRFEGARINHH